MRLKIKNTELELSYTLLCLAAICIILKIADSFALCALAITLHEAGHLSVMLFYGYQPDKIKISPFEIKISDPERERRRDRENFFIIFFGPFVNFICFIAFYLLYLYGYDGALGFAAANLSVGLFNSLPVITLDGGQLVYLLLSRKTGETKARRTVDILTLITVFPLAALGFLILFRSKGNFSLLFVCVYLIITLLNRNSKYY